MKYTTTKLPTFHGMKDLEEFNQTIEEMCKELECETEEELAKLLSISLDEIKLARKHLIIPVEWLREKFLI